MPLDRAVLEPLAVVSAGLAVVAVVAAVAAHVRLGRLRRRLTVLQDGGSAESFLAAASRSAQDVALLRESVRRLQADHAVLRGELAETVRRVAVVRYDAFPDLGGRLSFSIALLDDAGNGVVLTSINGRSETRSYAKGLRAGESDHTLSPEERQAIAAALLRRPPALRKRSGDTPAHPARA